MSQVPEEVRALAARREDARAAKDYALADELRDRITELGFRVVDGPAGSTLEPIAVSPIRRLRPRDVESVLEEPPLADVSVHWAVLGLSRDVVRALDAFRATAGTTRTQFVVADVTETDPTVYGDGVEVVALEPQTGWAAAMNAGLRRSRGEIAVVVDGSVEPTGDALGPLVAALANPAVGVCGPFGISTHDLREFHESAGVGAERRVDAIEGYLMAFRRDVVRDAGLFDEWFSWYRTADIELSFRIRETGRLAVVVDVPVRRHEHRMWAATAPQERDRLSKRNYYRFLERFRGRFDLLVEPQERA